MLERDMVHMRWVTENVHAIRDVRSGTVRSVEHHFLE